MTSKNLVKIETERLQQFIDNYFSGKSSIRVLEAGCGALTHIRLPSDAYVVGIDISREQLERTEKLDEAIHGDIQTYDLPESSFDMIICWNVLEHVKRPQEALKRFHKGLKKGGIVVITAPNPLSTKGVVTKLTPYSFHLWFYRTIRGWKEAGRNGNPPFPTYLKLSASPRAIRKFASSYSMSVVYERIFGYGDSRDVVGYKKGYVTAVVKLLNALLWIFSLGTVKPSLCQFIMVLRKE